MAFTPRTFSKGSRTEVANSYAEEAILLFDGWTPEGAYVPAADPNRHVKVSEIAALPELKAAFVAGGVYNAAGSLVTTKKLHVVLDANGEIDDLIIEDVA